MSRTQEDPLTGSPIDDVVRLSDFAQRHRSGGMDDEFAQGYGVCQVTSGGLLGVCGEASVRRRVRRQIRLHDLP